MIDSLPAVNVQLRTETQAPSFIKDHNTSQMPPYASCPSAITETREIETLLETLRLPVRT